MLHAVVETTTASGKLVIEQRPERDGMLRKDARKWFEGRTWLGEEDFLFSLASKIHLRIRYKNIEGETYSLKRR